MNNLRVVFMGTPDFAVPALRAVHGAGHTIVAVYTQPDKPAGRGREMTSSPVKEAALELGLPVYQPTSLRTTEVYEELQSLRPDTIVVAAYAQLLPQKVLDIPKYGCKNIHASLLPKYRGGAPIHWAIVNGEAETGITIMQMARGLDTGDIILQRSLAIGNDDTCGVIFDRLANLGAEMILEVLALGDLGESLRVKQDEELATYARTVNKEDGRIDFTQNAKSVHNTIRGLNPWPGAFTTLQGGYIKILQSRLGPCDSILPAGLLLTKEGKIYVGCGIGCIELLTLQPAGKRPMGAGDFLRGYVRPAQADVFFGV